MIAPHRRVWCLVSFVSIGLLLVLATQGYAEIRRKSTSPWTPTRKSPDDSATPSDATSDEDTADKEKEKDKKKKKKKKSSDSTTETSTNTNSGLPRSGRSNNSSDGGGYGGGG